MKFGAAAAARSGTEDAGAEGGLGVVEEEDRWWGAFGRKVRGGTRGEYEMVPIVATGGGAAVAAKEER